MNNSEQGEETPKHWREQFKEAWFRDNDSLPFKRKNELWKLTERSADMAFQYISKHVRSQITAPPPQPLGIDVEELSHEMADKWVFEINGHRWSNNDSTAGDNFDSYKNGFKAGYAAATEDLGTKLIKAMQHGNDLELEVERLKESEAIGFAEWLQDEKYYREYNTKKWTAAGTIITHLLHSNYTTSLKG